MTAGQDGPNQPSAIAVFASKVRIALTDALDDSHAHHQVSQRLGAGGQQSAKMVREDLIEGAITCALLPIAPAMPLLD